MTFQNLLQAIFAKRYWIAVGICFLIGFGILSFFPYITARTGKDIILAPPHDENEMPTACRWVFLIGRRPERQYQQDSTPFRNSPIALYEKTQDVWTKREGDLLTRSTTTCENPPRKEDLLTVSNYIAQKERPYEFGYVSVPEGVYRMSKAWSEEKSDPQAEWFRLSDWGTQGVIALDTPQIVRHCVLDKSNPDGEWRIVESPGASVHYSKTGTYLHGTVTFEWSHRDSKGCINLYSGKRMERPEWQMFLDWIQQHGLFCSEDTPVGLVIVPFDQVQPRKDAPLPDRLRMIFPKNKGRFTVLIEAE